MTLKRRLVALERPMAGAVYLGLSDDELAMQLYETCEALSAAGGTIAPDWRALIEGGDYHKLEASLALQVEART